MRIKNPTDFCAGLLFGGFGLWASVYAAMHYRLGTALRMGPGYFPTWIGALVALFGLVLALRALAFDGPPLPRVRLRPVVFLLAASLAFAYLLDPFGLVLATMVLVVVGAMAGQEFRLGEVALLATVLTLFAVLVFVYGLGLLFPLWPAGLG